jgi:hypothetical protein
MMNLHTQMEQEQHQTEPPLLKPPLPGAAPTERPAFDDTRLTFEKQQA